MTTEPTTKTENAPAPAPPQSVRIETTLWWEDVDSPSSHSSRLFMGKDTVRDKTRCMAMVRDSYSGKKGDAWRWATSELYSADFVFSSFHKAPTREAAKSAALQAVMGAIGAREVSNG